MLSFMSGHHCGLDRKHSCINDTYKAVKRKKKGKRMAKSLAKAVMSRNVVRIELREVFNSTPGDGRHLKTISIVFTLRIGRCKSEKDTDRIFLG